MVCLSLQLQLWSGMFLLLSIFPSMDVLQLPFPVCLPHSNRCSLFPMDAVWEADCDDSVHLSNEFEEFNFWAMSVWSSIAAHSNMSSQSASYLQRCPHKHCFEDYLLWIWWILQLKGLSSLVTAIKAAVSCLIRCRTGLAALKLCGMLQLQRVQTSSW